MGFLGDTMLGRMVNEKIKKTSYLYPWGDLLPLLKKNDLNIANLETTLTHSQKIVPKVFNFKSDPEHVQVLKEGAIDVVNLANNHSLDFGEEGLQETLTMLDSAKINYVGAGIDLKEAQKPVIITKNGIKIGILGATDNEPTWQASKNKPGINYISIDPSNVQFQQFLQAITTLKKNVDVVIISLHWGPNMREQPSQKFIEAAHEFIDAGADILHGHSAHIFQGIEIYKNKLIMYDTGDFIDDYMVDPILRNDRSFLFNVTIDKKGPKKITLIPTLIDSLQVNTASKKDAQKSLARIRKLSEKFGTKIIDNTLSF